MSEPKIVSVFCCTMMEQCTWQGFALHQGLGWGKISSTHPEWREMHKLHCHGRLVQLCQDISLAVRPEKEKP